MNLGTAIGWATAHRRMLGCGLLILGIWLVVAHALVIRPAPHGIQLLGEAKALEGAFTNRPDGSIVASGANPVLWHSLTPRPWARYHVLIDATCDIPLRIDLFAAGYDNPQQEVQLGRGNGLQHVILRTDRKVPKACSLRIYAGQARGDLHLHRLRIIEDGSGRLLELGTGAAGILVLLGGVLLLLSGRMAVAWWVFIAALAVGSLWTSNWWQAGTADSRWYIPAATSLSERGTLSLSQYGDRIQAVNGFGVVPTPMGEVYNFFPVGNSLLLAPAIPLARVFQLNDEMLAGWTARVWYAATCALLVLVVMELGFGPVVAVLSAAVLGLATMHLSTHSIEIWSSSGMVLVIAGFWWCLLRSQGGLAMVGCGVLGGVAYLIRPDAALFVVAAYVYRLITSPARWADGVWFGLGCGAVLGLFVMWSWTVFGTILPPYYQGSRIDPAILATALPGQLFSPNRGLFVFHPLFLLSLLGGALAWFRPVPAAWFFRVTGIHLVIAIFMVGCFPHWWGGHSFGPRLHAPLVLSLILLLLPVWWWVREGGCPRLVSGLLSGFALISLMIMLAIHLRGAHSPYPHLWSSTPVSVDEQPSRVYDWNDWQPLRRK